MDLPGVYAVENEIEIINPTKPSGVESAIVEDCLELRSVWGKLAFRFNLVQGNGHECYMEGIAMPSAPGVYEFSEPTIEPERECVLKLHISGESITLEDVDGNCRMGHCGARAGIGESTTFPRKKKARRGQCKMDDD